MGRSILLGQIITSPQSQYALTLRPDIPVEPIVGLPLHKAYMRADGGAGSYVYSIAHPPAWLSINAVTGQLIGTPPDTAEYLVEVTVQDGATTIAYAMIRIKARSPLVWVGGAPPVGEIGVPYEFDLSASGYTGTMSWALTAGNLPAGLSIVGAQVTGTPSGTYGYSYATITGTDSGTGATCVVALVFDIREQLYGTSVLPTLTRFTIRDGEYSVIDLSTLFAAGVPPYRVRKKSPNYVALSGMTISQRRSDGHWILAGVPSLALQGGAELVALPGVSVTDAIGMYLPSLDFEVQIVPRLGSVYAQKDGVAVGTGVVGTINFTGSAVKDVSAGSDAFTVDLTQQGLACSVIGVSSNADGDAASIQATTNNRVLARVSNALTWTQITPAMISATGTPSSTTVFRGDGTWATYVSSVGLSLPSIFSVSGSPVTGSGTLTASLATQSANRVWAGPSSGSAAAPTFRALAVADLPDTLERMVSAQAPAADTINNTNVATAFATNYTIAAADIKAGCVIRVRAHGSYGTTTGTPTITLSLRLSNTSVLTINSYTLPSNVANMSWEFEGDVYVPSISASVACRANGHCFIGAGSSAAGAIVMPQSTALSLATNASKQVQLFVTWGTANTFNTITLHQLHVEVLG